MKNLIQEIAARLETLQQRVVLLENCVTGLGPSFEAQQRSLEEMRGGEEKIQRLLGELMEMMGPSKPTNAIGFTAGGKS